MSAKPKKPISVKTEIIQLPNRGNGMRVIIRCYFPDGFVDWELGRKVERNRVRIIICSKTAYTKRGGVKAGKFLSNKRYDAVMRKAQRLLRENGKEFIKGYKQKGKYPVWVKKLKSPRMESRMQQVLNF